MRWPIYQTFFSAIWVIDFTSLYTNLIVLEVRIDFGTVYIVVRA